MLQICAEFITSHLLLQRNKYLHQPKVFDALKYFSSQLRKDSKHFGWRTGEIRFPHLGRGQAVGPHRSPCGCTSCFWGNPLHLCAYVQYHDLAPKSRSCPIWCCDLCHGGPGCKSRGDEGGCHCVPAGHRPVCVPQGEDPSLCFTQPVLSQPRANNATNEGLDDSHTMSLLCTCLSCLPRVPPEPAPSPPCRCLPTPPDHTRLFLTPVRAGKSLLHQFPRATPRRQLP